MTSSAGGVRVHIVNRMAPGGIETLVLDLMRSTVEGERTVAISLEGELEELIAAWPGLAEFRNNIVAMGAPAGRRFGIVPKLARVLARLRPGVVFTHHIGPLLYGGLAARLGLAGRLVHVEHDVWHYEENPSHVRLLKVCERVLRPSHFAVSRPIAARLRELLGTPRVEVVAPGIDLARYHPGRREAARAALGLAEGTALIGTVGRLHPVKGHRFLIEAVSRLERECVLVLVGEGEERGRLEALVRACGIEGRARFLGHRDDVEALIAGFDVFALPSLGEGLPRAVLEAQAAGVPVVASDVGALRDAVAPGTGRVVPPKDPQALAGALEAVLGDARAPEVVRAETRAFIAANYDFSQTRRSYTARARSAAGGATAQPQSIQSDA